MYYCNTLYSYYTDWPAPSQFPSTSILPACLHSSSGSPQLAIKHVYHVLRVHLLFILMHINPCILTSRTHRLRGLRSLDQATSSQLSD